MSKGAVPSCMLRIVTSFPESSGYPGVAPPVRLVERCVVLLPLSQLPESDLGQGSGKLCQQALQVILLHVQVCRVLRAQGRAYKVQLAVFPKRLPRDTRFHTCLMQPRSLCSSERGSGGVACLPPLELNVKQKTCSLLKN